MWNFTQTVYRRHLMAAVFVGLLLCAGRLWANHPTTNNPADGGLVEMSHPDQPLPNDASVPRIFATIVPDSMDGFNVSLTVQNFNIVVPLARVPDFVLVNHLKVMQGHIHLYINGEKKMRVYGEHLHVPARWLKPGMNSLTLSINNHMHATLTYRQREIQTTVIFDANGGDEDFIKNQYRWPQI